MKLPLIVAVQERVDVPEPVMEAGVVLHVMPVVGDAAAARLTTPVNPLTAVTVIDDVPGFPTLTATLVGLAEIVKS